MKRNLTHLRKHRVYSEDFKREMVSLFEQGKFSVYQLERLYGVSDASIYNWIYKFSTFNEKGTRIVEMKGSSTDKLKELEEKIRELERAVGQKQIKIDYLEKMIEIAGEEYGMDIKKNSGTRRSNGSVPDRGKGAVQ